MGRDLGLTAQFGKVRLGCAGQPSIAARSADTPAQWSLWRTDPRLSTSGDIGSTSARLRPRMGRMSRVLWWLGLLGLAVLQGAHAVGVTPEMLDLERNPVESLAAARKGLAETATAGPAARGRQLELQLQAAMAALMIGDRPSFEQHHAQAQTLAREQDDGYALALGRALAAGAAGESGRPQEAVSGARDALQMSERITDPLSRAFVGDMAAWALLTGKKFAEAEPLLTRAIEAYVAHGAVLRRATAQAGMGSLHDGLRDPEAGYRERQAAASLIRHLDAPYLKSYLHWALGRDALLARDTDKAREHFEASIRESKRMNDAAGLEAAAEQGLGLVAADSGRWADALARLSQAQPRLLAKGYIDLWTMGQAALARAQAELRQGDPEASLAEARAKAAKLADGNAKQQFLEREAGVMKALGRPQREAEVLAEVLAMERRLFAEARRTQLADLAVRHDLRQKELHNNELRLRNDLAEARLREQNTRQQLLVAVLGLGGAAVGLLLYTLVNQVRSRRHFSALALTDSLTGAPNRRAILEHLDDVLRRGAPGYVAMLDIDHFKRVNDRYGHRMGDQVLQAFFQSCQLGRREQERVGRLGGEEWLLVVSAGELADAPALFDRLRSSFQQQVVPDLLPTDRPTFSMGVCALRPGVTVSDMLAEADAVMYQAKAQGRNRLVVAPAPRGEAPVRLAGPSPQASAAS